MSKAAVLQDIRSDITRREMVRLEMRIENIHETKAHKAADAEFAFAADFDIPEKDDREGSEEEIAGSRQSYVAY